MTTIMHPDKTYNGWINYETWRIHLEWFDEYPESFTDITLDPLKLAVILEDYIYDTLAENNIPSVFEGYIHSFLQDANFLEIAKHLIDNREAESEEDDHDV